MGWFYKVVAFTRNTKFTVVSLKTFIAYTISKYFIRNLVLNKWWCINLSTVLCLLYYNCCSTTSVDLASLLVFLWHILLRTPMDLLRLSKGARQTRRESSTSTMKSFILELVSKHFLGDLESKLDYSTYFQPMLHFCAEVSWCFQGSFMENSRITGKNTFLYFRTISQEKLCLKL